MTGTPQFFSDNGVIDHLVTIAMPNPPPILPLGQTYFASFAPTDPCFGQASCAISFSFAGLAQGFPAGAVLTANVPSAAPTPPPILPIAVLAPGDPCQPTDPCHASGPIVAFDDPVVIGSWEVSIHPTPLPAALPLFATGLGALGLLGWRRKRKANRRIPARFKKLSPGQLPGLFLGQHHVRFWPLADMSRCTAHVRFQG